MNESLNRVISYDGEGICLQATIEITGESKLRPVLAFSSSRSSQTSRPPPLRPPPAGFITEKMGSLQDVRLDLSRPSFDLGLGCFGHPSKIVETGRGEINAGWMWLTDYRQIKAAQELSNEEVWGDKEWIDFQNQEDLDEESDDSTEDASTDDDAASDDAAFAASDETASDEAATDNDASDDAASDETASNEAATHDDASGDAASVGAATGGASTGVSGDEGNHESANRISGGEHLLELLDNLEAARPEPEPEQRIGIPGNRDGIWGQSNLDCPPRDFDSWIEETADLEETATMPRGTRYYQVKERPTV